VAKIGVLAESGEVSRWVAEFNGRRRARGAEVEEFQRFQRFQRFGTFGAFGRSFKNKRRNNVSSLNI